VIRFVIVASLLMVSILPSSARETARGDILTGRYAGKAQDSALDTLDFALQITEHNGVVTGTVSTEFGVSPIVGGTYRSGNLTLSFDVGGTEVSLTAKVEGRQIQCTYSASTNHGTALLNLISRNPVFNPDSITSLTKAQWREDVLFFATELERRHADAFHRITRQDYNKSVAALVAAIPHLKYFEIIVGMERITAMVGDAHTYVHLPDVFHRFPLSLYWFGSDLRVLRTTRPYKRVLGARLVAINGTPILSVRDKIREIFSQDETELLFLASSPELMMNAEVLDSLRIVPNLKRAVFSFMDDNDKRFDMTINPGGMHPDLTVCNVTVPTGFQSGHDPFAIRSIEDGKVIYATFKAYDNLEENAKKLFDLIDANPPDKLIIDMRQNSGGDFLIGRKYLIDEVKKRRVVNQKGRLFILVGRSTFSAAMSNAADFRNNCEAILVGEPIGERPNSFQERRLLILPNSNTVISYSTEYYSFAEKNVSAIVPDKQIDPSWESFKRGRDPAMEWILAYPGL